MQLQVTTCNKQLSCSYNKTCKEMCGATPLIPVGRSVQRSNRPPGSFSRNRPLKAFVTPLTITAGRTRAICIIRLDGTLWFALCCNVMLMRTCTSLTGFLLTFIVLVTGALRGRAATSDSCLARRGRGWFQCAG